MTPNANTSLRRFPPRRATAALALALALLTLVGGCARVVSDTGPSDAAPRALDPRFAEADAAYAARRYDRALALYEQLLSVPAPPESRVLANKRYALSAYAAGQYQKALTGLENWAAADPSATASWEWQGRYVKTLARLGRQDKAREQLARIIADTRAPWVTRAQAGIELFGHQAGANAAAQGARVLADLRAAAPTPADAAKMEEYFAKSLSALPEPALKNAETTVNEANRLLFPQSLIGLERARRAAATAPDQRAALRELADAIALRGDLKGRDLPGRILAKGVETLAESPLDAEAAGPSLPATSANVAVVLPLGGPFREFGGKVLKGIRLAQAAMAAEGKNLDIVVIDATTPGYLDNLRNLPPQVTLVGGPMHRVPLKEIQAAGLMAGRVFLAFMPTLGDVPEGVEAWRFFSSAEDEVAALLKLSLDDFGIKQFGLLRPEDRYGQTMGDLFALQTAQRGGQVTASAVYSPTDATGWDVAVLSMLQSGPGKAGFGAVYIPDEWGRADKILPHFFQHKVEDLLILGPQLWTEALSRAAAQKTRINIQNYRLAVCPGAWWPDNTSPAAQRLTQALATESHEAPDFWIALGFDFARFAATISPLPPNIPAVEVNSRLSRTAAGFDWSMAPLAYDPSGKANQHMFLFRPSVAGPVLLDPQGFRQRLEEIRHKGLDTRVPETESAYSAAPPETPEPLPGETEPGRFSAPVPAGEGTVTPRPTGPAAPPLRPAHPPATL